MLFVHFGGWASCRLATRPDPFDDPRGNLSGFKQFAFAGEPDLDRVIRFQDPPYVRSHTWPIGVVVGSIQQDAKVLQDHKLVGAAVNLLDNPVFEGRNVVITRDAAEPIYPFHFQLSKAGVSVSRKFVPEQPDYPFDELMPLQDGVNASVIIAKTGLSDIVTMWNKRLELLKTEYNAALDDKKPGLEERIALLETGEYPAWMFTQSMQWDYRLNGPVIGDINTIIGSSADAKAAWRVAFWFGGYDADAQSFYCSGTLSIPENAGEILLSAVEASSRTVGNPFTS